MPFAARYVEYKSVAWLLAAVAAAVAWHHAATKHLEEAHREEHVPFERNLCKDDQARALAAVTPLRQAVRSHVEALYASSEYIQTPEEAADLEGAGMERLLHLTEALTDVPTDLDLARMRDDAIRSVDEAHQVLAVKRSGSGLIQDDVLGATRMAGESSRQTVTYLKRDLDP